MVHKCVRMDGRNTTARSAAGWASAHMAESHASARSAVGRRSARMGDERAVARSAVRRGSAVRDPARTERIFFFDEHPGACGRRTPRDCADLNALHDESRQDPSTPIYRAAPTSGARCRPSVCEKTSVLGRSARACGLLQGPRRHSSLPGGSMHQTLTKRHALLHRAWRGSAMPVGGWVSQECSRPD